MKTTVIARAYGDADSARGIRDRLYRAGFPRYQMSLICAKEGEDADQIKAHLMDAWVPEVPAGTYAEIVAGGAGVVVVRASYKPLGAVRIANEAFATSGALDVGLAEQQFRVKTPPDHAPSILKDHPRFLTTAPRHDGRGGLVSEQLGLRLLSAQKPRTSALAGGKIYMGNGIKRKAKANSAYAGGGYMSQKFWPMPLLSTRKRELSVTENGGHPFSRILGWPTKS